MIITGNDPWLPVPSRSNHMICVTKTNGNTHKHKHMTALLKSWVQVDGLRSQRIRFIVWYMGNNRSDSECGPNHSV